MRHEYESVDCLPSTVPGDESGLQEPAWTAAKQARIAQVGELAELVGFVEFVGFVGTAGTAQTGLNPSSLDQPGLASSVASKLVSGPDPKAASGAA